MLSWSSEGSSAIWWGIEYAAYVHGLEAKESEPQRGLMSNGMVWKGVMTKIPF